MAIVSGLNTAAMLRLKHTRGALKKKDKAALEHLEDLCSAEGVCAPGCVSRCALTVRCRLLQKAAHRDRERLTALCSLHWGLPEGPHFHRRW